VKITVHHSPGRHLIEQVQHRFKEVENERNCHLSPVLGDVITEVLARNVVGDQHDAVNALRWVHPVFDIHEPDDNRALETVCLFHFRTPPRRALQDSRQICPWDYFARKITLQFHRMSAEHMPIVSTPDPHLNHQIRSGLDRLANEPVLVRQVRVHQFL